MEIVNKPWGYYVDIHRLNDIVFKSIVIHPGHAISYQVHNKRSEFWYIAKGRGMLKTSSFQNEEATTNFMVGDIAEGDYILIKAGNAHQIKNVDPNIELVIYEMQFGECDESDIIRLEDPYNRAV
jgi:mannose-1-phosphate guanylyltransferase